MYVRLFLCLLFKVKKKNIYDIIRSNIYNTEKKANSRCILEFFKFSYASMIISPVPFSFLQRLVRRSNKCRVNWGGSLLHVRSISKLYSRWKAVVYEVMINK